MNKRSSNVLVEDLKVFVYFNLHKKCWSVRALEGGNKGFVVNHLDVVYLREVSPKVSESGRQRVLVEKQKNVHAGIVGWVVLPMNFEGDESEQITYNPYHYEAFVYCEDRSKRFENSNWCKMDSTDKIPRVYVS